MNKTAEPESTAELIDALNSFTRVIPVGGETKQPLFQVAGASRISLRKLQGMVQYEPSEFTFTAKAGTPVADIVKVLSERRQYLPFDPMLVDAGSTIGGAVASGLSGPGRFRFGGIRDFLLGVQFITGDAVTVNAGGKVVKNAAGFDLPKFLVGSLGRFAIMTELTFKVFPLPEVTRTLHVQCESHQQAAQRMAQVAGSRLEPFAIDYRPAARQAAIQLGGPELSLDSLTAELRKWWGDDLCDLEDEARYWNHIRQLDWAPSAAAVKVASTLRSSQCLAEQFESDENITLHISVAGDVTWMLVKEANHLDRISQQLTDLRLSGLVVRGEGCHQPLIGSIPTSQMQQAIQKALDPSGRFCPWTQAA